MNITEDKPSRQLDVHKSSDHPEANVFVDKVLETYFPDVYSTKGMKRNSFRADLKVLLLDLYVSWQEDPEQTIGVGMSNSFYKKSSRYNALHISYKLIEIVHELTAAKLIGFREGSEWSGKVSRIWPLRKLIKLFEQAKFGLEDIQPTPDRECIILRDSKKNDIEYEDTTNTHRMRVNLRQYNELLADTFIDMPSLHNPVIKKKKGQVNITQNHKFVRRIFHNSSFEQGGRFYGGWWQSIPKEYRQKIYINDNPTIEDDFSALHIMLLYAKQGLEYDWDGEDPYYHPISFINDYDEARLVGKLFLLTALNAKDKKSGFAAARNTFTEEEIHYKGEFSNRFLEDYLTKVKDKHPPLEEYLCSNAGVGLMNIDSQITEKIVEAFTSKGITILCMHDSFIIQVQHDNELRTQMQKAVEQVSGTNNFKIKRKNIGLGQVTQWKHSDREYYLSSIKHLGEGVNNNSSSNKRIRTKGYEERMKKFYSNKH
jgi:hypothetical protein